MYNILYYDLENFDLDEVKVIMASLKEQLPETMSKKLIALPKGTELINYYEEQDLEYLRQGVHW